MTDTHGSSLHHMTNIANMALASLRRIAQPRLITILSSIALALLIGAGLIALLGVNPFRAYGALLDGAVGNKNSIAETLVRAIPLTLAGVGVSIAFRSGTFNVGAEGQLFLGGMASAWVGLLFTNLPGPILVALMIVAGMLAGALWAGIAGFLKIALHANEFINTIMMNYIAIFFVSYLLNGPLKDPEFPMAQTAAIPAQAKLFRLIPGTRLHAGFIIAVIVVALAYFLLWHTTWGFQLRVTGKNLLAARSAGINVKWVILSSLMASGALAGLAGYAEVAGVQLRMIENLSPGYGYTAIVVALLGDTNPPGVLVAAILFAALSVGASTMESAVGVPSSIVTIIQYLIVLLIMGRGVFNFIRQHWLRRAESVHTWTI